MSDEKRHGAKQAWANIMSGFRPPPRAVERHRRWLAEELGCSVDQIEIRHPPLDDKHRPDDGDPH